MPLLPRRFFRRPAALALLISVAAPFAGSARAQDATVLRVTVRAGDTGLPLPGALVSSSGLGIQGGTDRSGVLRLTDLAPGAHSIRASYLGYAPGVAEVRLFPGDSVSVDLDLPVQPIELAEVRVQTHRSVLVTSGFNQRRSAGFGTFVSRPDIERMQPRLLSDVLRRVAGMSLSPGRPGGTTRASVRGRKLIMGNCPIQYYVDGTMTDQLNVDDVPPQDVEGLEIYRGAATIPPAFNKGSAMCGVVMIWTRDQ